MSGDSQKKIFKASKMSGNSILSRATLRIFEEKSGKFKSEHPSFNTIEGWKKNFRSLRSLLKHNSHINGWEESTADASNLKLSFFFGQGNLFLSGKSWRSLESDQVQPLLNSNKSL